MHSTHSVVDLFGGSLREAPPDTLDRLSRVVGKGCGITACCGRTYRLFGRWEDRRRKRSRVWRGAQVRIPRCVRDWRSGARSRSGIWERIQRIRNDGDRRSRSRRRNGVWRRRRGKNRRLDDNWMSNPSITNIVTITLQGIRTTIRTICSVERDATRSSLMTAIFRIPCRLARIRKTTGHIRMECTETFRLGGQGTAVLGDAAYPRALSPARIGEAGRSAVPRMSVALAGFLRGQLTPASSTSKTTCPHIPSATRSRKATGCSVPRMPEINTSLAIHQLTPIGSRTVTTRSCVSFPSASARAAGAPIPRVTELSAIVLGRHRASAVAVAVATCPLIILIIRAAAASTGEEQPRGQALGGGGHGRRKIPIRALRLATNGIAPFATAGTGAVAVLAPSLLIIGACAVAAVCALGAVRRTAAFILTIVSLAVAIPADGKIVVQFAVIPRSVRYTCQ